MSQSSESPEFSGFTEKSFSFHREKPATITHRHQLTRRGSIAIADFNADKVQSAKDKVLSSTPTDKPAPDLVESWKRSQAAIGDPGNIRNVPHVPEALLDQHLLDMFNAPMSRFAEDLEGTGCALLLADSRGQVLQRWFEDSQAESHLDTVGTVRGAVLAENVVGTNGVGTVAASQKLVQIRGTEHYAEFYQNAVCTGSPVFHPLSRKLMAVVTLSSDMTPRADLFKPLVRSMSNQLEHHLLSVETPDSREMLELFLRLSAGSGRKVVGFGPQGAMMQSSGARNLSLDDINTLRLLGEEGRPSGSYVVELSQGPTLLEFTAIGTAGKNNLVVIGDEPTPRKSKRNQVMAPNILGESDEWVSLAKQVRKLQLLGENFILHGERGVGKASLALDFPAGLPIQSDQLAIHDAAKVHVVGSQEWLQEVSSSIALVSRAVIRGIETLSSETLDGLRAVIENKPSGTSIVLTVVPDNEELVSALEIQFNARGMRVPALRERKSDFETIWKNLCTMEDLSSPLQLTRDAQDLLSDYRWPGNIRELRKLISQLIHEGKGPLIGAADLPRKMQSTKSLTLIEQMEREAIEKALHEARGNREKAADILGVSRATVYRKLKTYQIQE